ncbi:MAG: hypothetical protein B7Y45_00340 [Sphingomonas sp. 28-66-16]|nr:MAG: hypothetical protein B7Y45_00340 [Sphingomonas sp. 28-66-16]
MVRPLMMIAGLALTIASATASSPDRRRPTDRETRALATALAGRVPGKPQNCVDQSRLQGPEIVGINDVLYRQSGRRIWRTTLRDSCPSLRGNPILVVQIYGNQLCSNDRFQAVNRMSRASMGGYCFFGPFVPYDKAP